MSPQIPTTYSRWRVQPGKGFDGLELVHDEPLGQPKRGQVLVRVHAVALNYRDLAGPHQCASSRAQDVG